VVPLELFEDEGCVPGAVGVIIITPLGVVGSVVVVVSSSSSVVVVVETEGLTESFLCFSTSPRTTNEATITNMMKIINASSLDGEYLAIAHPPLIIVRKNI